MRLHALQVGCYDISYDQRIMDWNSTAGFAPGTHPSNANLVLRAQARIVAVVLCLKPRLVLQLCRRLRRDGAKFVMLAPVRALAGRMCANTRAEAEPIIAWARTHPTVSVLLTARGVQQLDLHESRYVGAKPARHVL